MGRSLYSSTRSFTDDNRLKRGRSYASGGKVKSFEIDLNKITAKVRGSVNPYFGVYKEPTYNIEIQITPIAKTHWNEAIQKLSSNDKTGFSVSVYFHK